MTDTTFQAPDERELDILAHVHHTYEANEHQSQRSIARALGMSVGLTNAILRRLVDKGFLMMRRINQHNAHYLVTPAGIEQISRRSYLYLRRTIGHVVRYKEHIRAFCREQAAAGVREIVLVGESDLAFLLEWCAEKEGLTFEHSESIDYSVSTIRPMGFGPNVLRANVCVLLAESYPELPVGADGPILLHEVILRVPREHDSPSSI